MKEKSFSAQINNTIKILNGYKRALTRKYQRIIYLKCSNPQSHIFRMYESCGGRTGKSQKTLLEELKYGLMYELTKALEIETKINNLMHSRDLSEDAKFIMFYRYIDADIIRFEFDGVKVEKETPVLKQSGKAIMLYKPVYQGLSQEEIGGLMNLSRQRISQLEDETLEKITNILKAKNLVKC